MNQSWTDCAGLITALQQSEHQSTEVRAQITSNQAATTKNGKPYQILKLQDASQNITVRVWQDSPIYEAVQELTDKQFIAIQARWSDNGYGPEPSQPKIRLLEHSEREQLLDGADPALRQRQDRLWSDIEAHIDSIQEPRLSALLQSFLSQHQPAYRRAAAAAHLHHARRGGLVEHVAQMMNSAHALCQVYPKLNRDLLLTGTFFHDVGKLWENGIDADSFSPKVELSGELLGHISIGIEVINRLWLQLQSEPHPAFAQKNSAAENAQQPAHDTVRLHLLHLIASHHGEHEWGSPVLPKTPEAFALHYIDNLDAKLEMITQGLPGSPELAPGIHAPVRPLRQRLIDPLPPLTHTADAAPKSTEQKTPQQNQPSPRAPKPKQRTESQTPSQSSPGPQQQNSSQQAAQKPQPTPPPADRTDQSPQTPERYSDELF